MREQILEIIENSVRSLDGDIVSAIDFSLGENTPLYGKDGNLDSIALVNLIISVETTVEDEMGKVITLADERAMSQESSPFATIGSFTDYIIQLINESEAK
ncbi:MAG: acyl carrier protein [Ignavibacteriae bacterium]|nr:acyl carrier protein [Ignavibacteriota bacterium]MCB9244061.1 acyl carrier protein [Ignavibacteriales bacterium]